MKLLWSHLLLPVTGAVIAYVSVPTSFWDGAKMPLMTGLSVIAAGVLVRLARGLPFTNADQLQVDEARAISMAVKQSARGLRALMIIVFLCMGMVVFSAPIAEGLHSILAQGDQTGSTANPAGSVIDPTISAIVGALLAYVLIRIFAVISGDVGLVELQTKYLVAAVERKQAEQFDRAHAASESVLMKTPEGYGKVIQ